MGDPLGYIDSRDMRRYEEMEIKHGRAAMLGFTHVILTEAGLRFPGYLSDGTFGGAPIKFADVPAGAINTVLAIPGSSWAQIICLCGVLESGVFTQSPDREAGDIAPEWGPWVRGDDGHHGHHPARAPGRGWALPDGWPRVRGRSA